MTPFQLLDHTADIGLSVTAASCPELFREAARGLGSLLCATPGGEGVTRRVELEGLDLEDLLVRWLAELLWLFESEGLLPARCEFGQLEPTRLAAEVHGALRDPSRHPVEREIKAVTYHRLCVREQGGTWEARVYFDL